MQTTVIGAVEVSTGGLTGQLCFKLIPNRKKGTMVPFIESFVEKAATLFTDSHKSYQAWSW